MKPINQIHETIKRPVKILQYGEGNFLRAFVCQMVDIANEKECFNGNIQIVKPIAQGALDAFKEQDCVYTVLLRGKENGVSKTDRRVVRSVAGALCAYKDYDEYSELAKNPELRFILSNTTEAGIAFDENDKFDMSPPASFPGKLTKFLYARFTAFNGSSDKGLIILPVELIDKNGSTLLDCCLKMAALWELPNEFISWLKEENIFCNTLVDRIVTGYPEAEAKALEDAFGYRDKLIATGELFGLWVIESERIDIVERDFPLKKAGLPVMYTKDLTPYRERKVRILNGAHTGTVLAAFLSGVDTVGEMMKDKDCREFLEKVVYNELSPFVPLPANETKKFADAVMERFENPHIRHNLLSIALNSVSKFKVRNLPTILETQEKTGKLPPLLCFSLAALIRFYTAKDREYEVKDSEAVLDFFNEAADLPAGELAEKTLGRKDFWGLDLTAVPGLLDMVAGYLTVLGEMPMREAMRKCCL